MFDANWNFSISPPATEPLDTTQGTSTDISPFTSRCGSPSLAPHERDYVSRYASRRCSDFDHNGNSRHPSVTALTTQLEHHGISHMSQPDSPVSLSENEDQDEGFYDGPDTPSTNYSDYGSDFDPSLWDLNMADLSVTSSPRPSLSLEAQALSSFTQRRKHRQALVRLQCLAKRAPDIAMLIEECHPSSLPVMGEAPWNVSKSRSNSAISLGITSNGRIEKEKPTSAASMRKPQRMRKRTTR
jgi:hypothetical protein